MIKNSLMKFIDSCVGNIARKIEDEFRESDHPRDKGGKFTSKGNEGRGGGASKEEKSSSSKPAKKVDAKASRHIHQVLEDEIRQIAENSDDKDEFKINLGAFLEDYVTDDMADTDERAMDNFGYDKETVHAVAEEMKGEIDSIADDIFEEDDDTSVTGPEDRDYMNEEDDDDDGMYYGPDMDKIKEYATDKLKEYGVGDPKFTSKSTIKYRENGTQSISIPMDQYGRALHVTADPNSNSIRVEYMAGVDSFTTKLEGYGHREMSQALDEALKRVRKKNTNEQEYWKKKNKDFPGPNEPDFYE